MYIVTWVEVVSETKCMYENVYLIGHSLSGLFRTNANKHNLVKNPNWWEANQLAIYKRSRDADLGASGNNIS